MATSESLISVDAYGGGGFRLSGAWHPGSVIIRADSFRPWVATVLDEVSALDLAGILQDWRADADFLLLGVGERQRPPPALLRGQTRAMGLGLEFMSTEAAARMHNVLAAEGRRLVTALIAL